MFHLFAGDQYYPSGGVFDLIDSFKTLQEAQDRVKELSGKIDWYHITNANLAIVEEDCY